MLSVSCSSRLELRFDASFLSVVAQLLSMCRLKLDETTIIQNNDMLCLIEVFNNTEERLCSFEKLYCPPSSRKIMNNINTTEGKSVFLQSMFGKPGNMRHIHQLYRKINQSLRHTSKTCRSIRQ